jgi:hypothetical protein
MPPTFAISAQLFPASLIVFNLCSSAGVQGVFVRLFFAGGPIGETILGSSIPAICIGGFIGPDIASNAVGLGPALFLFRGEGGISDLKELSVLAG